MWYIDMMEWMQWDAPSTTGNDIREYHKRNIEQEKTDTQKSSV